MNDSLRAELESLRADGLSAERRRDLARGAAAAERWDRAHPRGVAAALAWIGELRAAFGDPPVDRRVWRGDDFRL